MTSLDINNILGVDDIAELNIKDTNEIANVLYQRLLAGYQYTKVGDIMLIIAKALPTSKSPAVDTSSIEKNFAQKLRESLSAAVSMVNRILTSMLEHTKVNQAVIFLGDQQSGKSDALIRVLAFFKTASLVVSTRKSNVIGDLVIKSCQLAEAFGHSRTTKNSNCSRIAKYIKVYHTSDHKNLELLSWTIDIVPFDRSRVNGAHFGRPNDIGNYHVFYQLVAGLSSTNKPLAAKLKLSSIQNFKILSLSYASKLIPEPELDMQNDSSSFTSLIQIFRLLGFSDDDQNSIFAILAAILHLGNITASCDLNSDRNDRVRLTYVNDADPANRMTISQIASILGIPSADFEEILLKWPLADGQPLYAMFESTIILEINNRIMKVMEFLYWQVVSWIILCINQRFHENIVEESDNNLKYVSFVDFPGFEDNYPWNSLETLFVNYANEKLCFHGDHYASNLIKTHKATESDAESNTALLNNKVLDLLTRERVGIFPILSKFSRLQAGTGSSDDVSMLLSQRHPQGVDILTSSQHKTINHGFRITHFNKSTVCYDVIGFIDKNRVGHDCIRGIDTLISASTQPFVVRLARLFAGENLSPRATSVVMNPKQQKEKTFTSHEILTSQIDNILMEMSEAHSRYIVCIDSRTGNNLHSPTGLTVSSPIRPTSSRSSPKPVSKLLSTPQKISSPQSVQTQTMNFKIDVNSPPVNDALIAQLNAYHVPKLLNLHQSKYSATLPLVEFYSRVEMFGRSKGWYLNMFKSKPDVLSSRCASIADYIFPKDYFLIGKVSIMFTSLKYEDIIREKIDQLLYTEACIIQAYYRRHYAYRRFKIVVNRIITLQRFFRKNLWRKMTLKVLEVRRERRLSVLRLQEEEERKIQDKLEEEELERQFKEQFLFAKQSADVEAKYTAKADIPKDEESKIQSVSLNKSEDQRRKSNVSFNLDANHSPSSLSSSLSSSPKSSKPNSKISPSHFTFTETPKTEFTTPTRSKAQPLSHSPKITPVRGVSGSTPRSAAWIESSPYDEYGDESPVNSIKKPTNEGKQLSSYQSIAPAALDLESEDVNPDKANQKLVAYNILATKLVALWRNFTFRVTIEKLQDAILRKKGRVLLEIVKSIKERWDINEEEIAHMKVSKQKFRNMYHLAASVGFIECINGLGVTMLDLITRDSEKNNWLHMMVESPNIDFARRLHTFVQRYDQIIKSAQPVRLVISSLLTIISTPASLIEGYLLKQNSSEKFQKRYVVLTSNKIAYYNSNSPSDLVTPSDTILISVGQTAIRHNKDVDYSFIIDSLADIKSTKGKKRFVFRAESKEEYFNWLKALSQVTTIVTTRDPNITTSAVPINVINSALTKIWVSEVNELGDTPLHRLARGGVVKEDDTVNDISFSTLLQEFEVSYQIISVAAWLIDGGCPFDTPNNNGETPFDLAIASQSYDLAAYLYRLGADYQHLKKKDIKDIIDLDCFKGQTYHHDSDVAPHLPPPEKWYSFTYLSIYIQEIHLKSSSGRSSGSTSGSMSRRKDEKDDQYFAEILECPYLAITVRDTKGRPIESPQILSVCGYRGLGVLVWGQTFHLQTPLQALNNKSIIDIALVNYNSRTKLSEEVARGQYEIDFSTVNSGPASIFLQSSVPLRQTTSKSPNPKQRKSSVSSPSSSSGVQGFTLLAEMALSQRSFDLIASNLEEYVLTTFDLDKALGYDYKLVHSIDYSKNVPSVRFVGNVPRDAAPGQLVRNFAGHQKVHVRIPSNCLPGERIIVEASVKKIYGRSFFYRDIENGLGDAGSDVDDDRSSVRSGRSSRSMSISGKSSRSASPRASRVLSRGSIDESNNSSPMGSARLSGTFESPNRRSSSFSSLTGFFGTGASAGSSSENKPVSPPAATTAPRTPLPRKGSIIVKSGI